ncbi:MAG: hypothetical protein ACR2JC_02025 [Chloroflexota bacterium]
MANRVVAGTGVGEAITSRRAHVYERVTGAASGGIRRGAPV